MKEIENLKPFPKFCCSIGYIPTSYKVSMSYEEQLMWLCDFLENEVIPTINQNGQAVEELQNLYNELKSYVDNYFENLDVQEEINNKLDEMATDGTLAEIINTQIFQELNTAIQNNSNNINKIENEMKTYPYFDIQKNGGYTDGTTANDTIFNNAKDNGYRKFYFSQNENNNANYYFANLPNFNDCEILTDNNVVINIPNAEFFNNSNSGLFKNNIKLYDRNKSKNYMLPSNNYSMYNKIDTSINYNIINLKDNNDLSKYKYVTFNLDTRNFTEKSMSNYFSNVDYQMKHTAREDYYLCVVPIRGVGQVIESEIIPSSGNSCSPCFGALEKGLTQGFYTTNGNGYQSTVWNAYGQDSTYTDEMNILKHNSMPYCNWNKPYRIKMKVLDKDKIVCFINDIPYTIIPYDETKTYFGFGIFRPSIGDSMMFFSDYFQENTPLNFNTKILLLGDSRFAGGDTSLNISTLLKNNLLLNSGLQNVEIINESVGGYNTTQVLEKLKTLDLTQYDFVVTNVGINNNANINDNATNAYGLMRYIISQNCIPILLLPATTNNQSIQALTMQERYNNIYSSNLLGYVLRGAAYKYKLYAIIPNCYGNATTENQFENITNDGIHPNNYGIIQYSFNIANAILNLLKS